MELEFDKEIDAILRKARGTGTAVLATAASSHADADTIAAFAENALPEKTKLLYMEHFADCERCRKQLSHAVLMNAEAVATAASASVLAPVAETAVPWYQKLFNTQNLALAMGGLVLAFGGFLGYRVLQSQNEAKNSTVSQVTEQERAPGGPYFGGELEMPADSANMSAAPANTVRPAANTTANSAVPQATPSENIATGVIGGLESDSRVDVTSAMPTSKPAAAPPPPLQPFVVDGATDRDEAKADDLKNASKELPKDLEFAKRKQMEDRSRDLPPAKGVGPSRSGTGPLQTQTNQSNNNVFEMSVTRLVGGKTFNNRDGVWYDSAYGSQATINIRRGTDAFKKLDGGVRNIANTIGGTVVIVSKGKAYRIQ